MSESLSTTINPAEIVARALDAGPTALLARSAAVTAAYDALAVAAAALNAAAVALKASRYDRYDACRVGAVDAEAIVVKAMKVISTC